ncbi:MAG: 1-(5-phosphoribosyl)-5-[(5-phosphoribosylamino)methylideneamino]imidazole-4-carboxamide isomerase [Pirellulales bacterium]|nr:1-(5-phosphoribosyl)-5-[(5-phosphoribosylamino)methylideneamino]imidazole-4-carboxamide isomerase [Pirellulales bacterium]
MQIWPAIDLRGGQCVRLKQGDYAQETVYSAQPADMARHWVSLGAQYLHLVDLDGARDGQPTNLPAVQQILAAVTIPCELGGGIRDAATIKLLLDAGLTRLVLGTRAIADQTWFRNTVRQFPGRLVMGIDAKDGLVATHGWLSVSETRAIDLAREFENEPLAAIIYTDIATDGMLAGPNLPAMDEMRRAVQLPVIASGGITTAEDVRQLAKLPMAGAIIGRALYENRLTLPEALAAAVLRN